MRWTQIKSFWEKELSRDVSGIDLGSNNRRSGNKKTVQLQLTPGILTKVAHLSEKHLLSNFIYNLACLKTVLKFYSSEEVISVITVVPGSIRKNEQNGLLPVISEISDDLTCTDLLQKVKRKVIDVFNHQPFDFLNFGMTRDSFSGYSLVGFCHTAMQDGAKLNGCSIIFKVAESFVQIDYDDTFDDHYILQVGNHYLRIMEIFSENLQTKLSELDFLSQIEYHSLVYGFNNKTYKFDENRSFIGLFEDQVNRSLSQIAIQCGRKSISYKELDDTSNQVSYFLSEHSIRKNEIVIVLVERSEKLVACILGLWKINAIYLPIDPANHPDRIKKIIRNSKAGSIIIEAKLLNLIQGIPELTNVILYERIRLSTKVPVATRISGPLMSDVAYIIYTSGSTGDPKGVMVEHLGMLNHMYAKIEDLKLNANSTVAQTASQGFDISIWQLLCVLLAGGKVRIYNNASTHNPENFIQNLTVDNVNVVELVPSYLSSLLDNFAADILQKSFRSVHYLIVTGEEFKTRLAKKISATLRIKNILNAYGPTEASDDITHFLVDDKYDIEPLPIGKPLPNVNIYVLNKAGKLCPVNVKGEICVSGICVGRGYLNDDFKTSLAFTTDPFVKERGRLYKTGDIGRWLPDGNLQFFGRKDEQIKIRGNRIELRDIEINLLRISYISEAAVIFKKSEFEESYLHGFVCLEKGRNHTEEQIKKDLGKVLPKFMVPANFTILKKFPLSANGKIDKNGLISMLPIESAGPSQANVGKTGRKVIDIAKNILGYDEITVATRLFEAEGNLIMAWRFICEVNLAFGSDLTLKDVIDNPTIESIVKKLAARTAPRKENNIIMMERDVFEI